MNCYIWHVEGYLKVFIFPERSEHPNLLGYL